jgi:replicative DNA helicase
MDRVPPHSREAEQQVIASLFRLPECRDDLFSRVRAEDLYLDAHQLVWRAAADLHHRGQPAELVAVAERLKADGDLANVGAAYLAELWDANPTGFGWEYYAGIVADHATRRRLILTCSEMARDAFDGVAPAGEMLGELERRVFSLGDAGHVSEPVSLAEAMSDALHEMNERLAGRGSLPISTGFDSLNNVIGGFKKGQLIIVAARPAVGKSAIALNFSLFALEQVPVLFFSQEMSRVELASRALAFYSDVPLHVIDGTKRPTGEQVRQLIEASQFLRKNELWIDDRSHLSPSEIARTVRREMRRIGAKLVVVDYLQRMNHDKTAGDTTTRQVGETAKQMKTLARNCDVPVICLAQLNRGVEGRGDGKPRLSDLRDSGEIEQEADVVLMLHPHERNPSDPTLQQIDVLIEKQRNGPTSLVTLDYRRPATRFEEPKIRIFGGPLT